MKKITLLLSFLIVFTGAKAQSFSDGFESYTAGELAAQSPIWRTWTGQGGGPEDVMVVSTDNHTTGGSKSIYFSSTDEVGGPTDCVLPIGKVPLTSGHFTFKSWFKVPALSSAYFNFQGDSALGEIYTLDLLLDSTGVLSAFDSLTELTSTNFPFNTWFELTVDADLDKNEWELLVNGIPKGTWKMTHNKIYAIDFYPLKGNKYWVDDVSYTITGASGTNPIDNGLHSIQLAPNPATDLTSITMSLKAASSVSVEIYSVDGSLVASKAYGKIAGINRQEIDTQELAQGVYFVKVNVNDQPTVLKLVKE